jgi:hypothetical protein
MKEGNATENSSRHDLATIRALMRAPFAVNPLEHLCQEHPEYRPASSVPTCRRASGRRRTPARMDIKNRGIRC